MPNATRQASRFGPLTDGDLARVEGHLKELARDFSPARAIEWQSWCRILFALQEAKRDG